MAEDSFLLRAGVVRVLEDTGFVVVGEARDAQELLGQVREHQPDVVVTDIRMPPTLTDEGLRAAAVIRSELPQTGVVVLSQYVKESYAIQLLDESAAGVGYLLKDRVMEPRGFAEAVRQVARGGSALDPEVVAQMLERRRRGGPLDELSATELAVLAAMAEGRDQPRDRDRPRDQRARPAARHRTRVQQARSPRRRRRTPPSTGRPHVPPRAGELRARSRFDGVGPIGWRCRLERDGAAPQPPASPNQRCCAFE